MDRHFKHLEKKEIRELVHNVSLEETPAHKHPKKDFGEIL